MPRRAINVAAAPVDMPATVVHQAVDSRWRGPCG